ncbi:MAG: hypothetical protein QM523_09300 [Candidatus Pacebacteria bacterium]|nr:hypothetical protein [Candidatus Paceibacterota bacterium]
MISGLKGLKKFLLVIADFQNSLLLIIGSKAQPWRVKGGALIGLGEAQLCRKYVTDRFTN